MPGDLIMPPNDFNNPDSSLNLVSPPIHNFQIIDNNSLNLQDIIKADGGLMGAYNAMNAMPREKITLTGDEMHDIFPNANSGTLEEVTNLLNKYMYGYGLTNMQLVAQFLGEVYEETGGLTKLVESLNYSASALVSNWPEWFAEHKTKNADGSYTTTPPFYDPTKYARHTEDINDIVYHNYYGRGLLQLSKKDNYQTFSDFYNNQYHPNPKVDFVACPELVQDFPYSVISALWYFQKRVMGGLDMKTATMSEITHKINTRNLGSDLRAQYYKDALHVLKVASLNPLNRFNPTHSSYPFELFPPHKHPHYKLPLHSTQVFTPLCIPLKQPLKKMNLDYMNQPYESQSMFEQYRDAHYMNLNPPHQNTLHHTTTPQNHPIHQTPPAQLHPIPQIRITGFNTTPPGIGNSSAPSITQPVIQNITINNNTTSTISPADIQKHMADLLTAAVSDAHIGKTV